jgi:hypothetical protein
MEPGMKKFLKTAVAGAAMAGAALLISAPADAGVHIGIGVPAVGVRVGGPAYYYGPGYYPPGPCDAYNSYYNGDCGYSVYNGPIYLDGAYVSGPHYYRWYNGAPTFWYRGGWHNWNGWRGAHFGWDHREGWGWRDGRWNRGWGGGVTVHGTWHGGGHDWHDHHWHH